MCKIESAIKFAERVIGYTWNHFDVQTFIRRKCSLPKNAANLSATFSRTPKINHNKAFVGLLLAKAAGVGEQVPELNWSLLRGPGILPKQYSLAETMEMLLWCSENNCDSNALLVNYILSEALSNLKAIDDQFVYKCMKCSILNSLKCNQSPFTFRDIKVIENEALIIKIWESLVYTKTGAIASNGYSSLLAVAQHSSHMQRKAFDFGKMFAYATKLDEELNSNYIYSREECLNLNLPLLLYLHSNPSLIDSFDERQNCSFTAFKVYNEISKTDLVSKAKQVLRNYVSEANEHLRAFENSRAKQALLNVLAAIYV